MIDLREQVRLHLASLHAAGVLLISNPFHKPSAAVSSHMTSTPVTMTPEQFRRCPICAAYRICEFSPSTALPCDCGGELLLSPVALEDIRAERSRCADALERLATRCAEAGGADGKVTASGAAAHMKQLAQWMREGKK